MIGFYRVALSLLILLTAIAAKAEDPMMALMSGGFGVGLPTPGLRDGRDSGVPQGGARQAFVDYCNVKCIEDRTAAAAAVYANRNQQTTASIMGTSQGAGSGASAMGGASAAISGSSSSGGSSASGGAFIDGSAAGAGFRGSRGIAVNSFNPQAGQPPAPQCDPAWQNLSAGALLSIQNNPATSPATLQAIQHCLGGGQPGFGVGMPPEAVLYTDPGQCVVSCMANVDAQYGPKPEERGMDPSALVFLLGQANEGQRGIGEPTPPWQMGDSSDGSSENSFMPPPAGSSDQQDN